MKKITNKYLVEAIDETLKMSDINPFSKAMAQEIAYTIKSIIENQWEGKFIKGDFFLKQKDGSYISMNSLRTLK